MKLQPRFIIKASILYCVLSTGFSIFGLFLPGKTFPVNPLISLNPWEVIGHVVWGLVAGAVSLSLRYCLLGGILSLLLDSDHFVGFLHLETVSRMSHSIFFGILSVIIMMMVFGKRNYLLGAIAISALLAHLSFDVFVDKYSEFPIFTPFYNSMIHFQRTDWIFLEIIAVVIVGSATILKRKHGSQSQIS
jgi:hypothetical protein